MYMGAQFFIMQYHILFEAICPVTYIWRPRSVSADEEGCNADECNKTHSADLRQLWIWMHPSALIEGYNALRTACLKKMDHAGVVVKCLSLSGQLASISDDIWHWKKCSRTKANDGFAHKHSKVLSEEQSYSKAVVSVVVSDPRCVSAKSRTSVPRPDLGNDHDNKLDDDCQAEEHFTSDENAGETEEELPTSPLDCENGISRSKCKDIWDAAGGAICPPLEENVICTEKYHRRLSLFCLKDTNSGKINEVQGSRMCPVMLLRNTNKAGSLKGWSIILPLSWVKPFWMTLVSNGAHAIGLREKRWIANDVGLPYFPSDYPDCNAYYASKAIESAELDQKMELCPLVKRPFEVATIPPWNSICNSANMEAPQLKDNASSTSPMNSSKEVVIARTSQMLKSFSNEVSVKNLFSLDDSLNQEKSAYEHKKLCFVRLLLHAYKEGSFEEGAVICAPNCSDIGLWRCSGCRPEDDESKLQVPQSSLASGKWEIHLPDDHDPVDVGSYREPIGFVTSGFFRGSKKPVAVAVAEVTRLASLRQEQLKPNAE